MSEETAGADSASEGSGAGVDPVAVSLALGGASQAQFDAFLEKQSVLVEKQSHLADLQAKELAHADQGWGRDLLQRGDTAKAMEKFKASSVKSPHFADPLEGWGEALMAQNRSDLALAKFTEAEKYAPNWGRLHLKWGEALVYAGRRDEAKAQFARTVQLDLTASEKTELAEKVRP